MMELKLSVCTLSCSLIPISDEAAPHQVETLLSIFHTNSINITGDHHLILKHLKGTIKINKYR